MKNYIPVTTLIKKQFHLKIKEFYSMEQNQAPIVLLTRMVSCAILIAIYAPFLKKVRKIFRENSKKILGFTVDLAGTNIAYARFGKGIYFGDHSSKAHGYASENSIGKRAMLLCEVATGVEYVLSESATEFKLPKKFHSVRGIPGMHLNFPESVVYTNEAALPMFAIIYKEK
jgi:hypothetical protein